MSTWELIVIAMMWVVFYHPWEFLAIAITLGYIGWLGENRWGWFD